MDIEVLKHLPNSFQVWQRIEEEAERRAEQRFQEIMKGKATGAGTPAASSAHLVGGADYERDSAETA